jgi:hypothetical protein
MSKPRCKVQSLGDAKALYTNTVVEIDVQCAINATMAKGGSRKNFVESRLLLVYLPSIPELVICPR